MKTNKKSAWIAAVYFLIFAVKSVINLRQNLQQIADISITLAACLCILNVGVPLALAALLFVGRRSAGTVVMIETYAILNLISIVTVFAIFTSVEPIDLILLGASNILRFVAFYILALYMAGTVYSIEPIERKRYLFGIAFIFVLLGNVAIYAYSVLNAIAQNYALEITLKSVLGELYVIFGFIATAAIGIWVFSCKGEITDYEKPDSKYYVSIGKHILLSLITFGIWRLVWVYKATKFTNQHTRVLKRIPLLNVILYTFVPFYPILWSFKTARTVDRASRENDLEGGIRYGCLVMSLFGNVIYASCLLYVIQNIITKLSGATSAIVRQGYISGAVTSLLIVNAMFALISTFIVTVIIQHKINNVISVTE